MNFSGEVETIKEFESSNGVFGIYSVIFKDKQEVFIRNGNSIGAVKCFLGESASQCVNEIRDDVKKEFLEYLAHQRGVRDQFLKQYE